jgi:hypothetical protein
MAMFEDVFKANIGTGLAVGVGALMLGPVIAPAMVAILRPVAKGVIKAGLYTYDRASEGLAQINEMTGDIVAEARAEMRDEGRAERGGAEEEPA